VFICSISVEEKEAKKMHFLTLILTFFLFFSSIFGQECVNFTLGDCDFKDDAVVGSFTLPGDQAAFVLCQELCQIEERSKFRVFLFFRSLILHLN